MGKLLMTVSLLFTLTLNLMYDSRVGVGPTTLRHQRVVVTGASSGIGEQLAYQYAKLGARLVITSMKADSLTNISRTCRDLGAQEVHYVAADMADPKDQFRVIDFAEKHLGGLDQLILNHAVLIDAWWTGSPENQSTLEQAFRTNVFSYVDLASKALPMLTANRGRIGIVSSGSGEIGTVRSSVYSAGQFALRGFFSSLRQELRHKEAGVSVTIVTLGPVATDNSSMARGVNLPTDRLILLEDAAWAILENVAWRRYNVRFDWKMRVLLGINDFFPAFFENNLPSFVLNDSRAWLPRLVRFIMPVM